MSASATATINGTAGAEDEFRVLYERYAGVIRRYAMKFLGDAGQAEDVLQETMIRAWRATPAYPPESVATRCWLLRIARNVAIDRIRARNVRPAESGPVGEDHQAVGSVGDCAERVVDRLYLLGVLSALQPRYRAVLYEIYFKGSTMAEAAAALALPVGTVKSRSFHALRVLRAAVQDDAVR